MGRLHLPNIPDLRTIDRGVVAALVAAALFGLSTPLAKVLVGAVSPLLLAGLLYLGSGLGLALLIAFRRLSPGYEPIALPRGAGAWSLAGAIGAGGVIAPYLLMYGLASTDGAAASLILNLEAVFTALLAWFVFGESFDRRIAVGMALIVGGGVVLSLQAAAVTGGSVGVAAIALACLAWAVDNNLTRNVSGFDPMSVACAKGLVAGSCNVALAMLAGTPMPAAASVFFAGVLGFIGYGASLTLFVFALRRLGTARTGAYFSAAPFFGALLAVALGAPMTMALGAAGLLMGAGVWLHMTERHVHPHRHAAASHEHLHVHDQHHAHPHEPSLGSDEAHSHPHVHDPIEHAHRHFPDAEHRHQH